MAQFPVSRAKKFVFAILSAAFVALLFELLASITLMYTYRIKPNLFQSERSYSSSVNLIRAVGVRLGIVQSVGGYERKEETRPAPFFVSDSELGYKASPGLYTHSYSRRLKGDSNWQHFRTKVLINSDGTRWTGNPNGDGKPSVYVFGDSFVFGTGVHDEQTFSFLLQQARPDDVRVRLFALGGYGLVQAFLTFKRLRPQITANDVIILGYADFYDVRHVLAPSLLRETTARAKTVTGYQGFFLPRASIKADGDIEISYQPEDCALNRSYCAQPDPPHAEMTKVSAALINGIAIAAKAPVYLLHFDGNADNPIFDLLNPRVVRISALDRDFDHFVRDNIAGFDLHPGPYWHYAISRKLLQSLPELPASSGDSQ
jgi:hypothetical protein